LIGKTVFDISPPDLAELHHSKDCELLKAGGAQLYEARIVDTNDVARDVIFSKAVFTDSQGAVAGLIGNILDLTELRQTEQMLEARETFLQRVLEQSPFATWISDIQGTLQYANPALKKFLNVTDEQIVGKYNVLSDPVVARQGLVPLIRTVYEHGETVTFDCDWDGTDYPSLEFAECNSVSIEATMFPVHDPKGTLTNVVLIWIDVTDRKKADKERERLEAQLQQAAKMEALGTLAGGIAHDFNNLLMPIMGHSELAMLAVGPNDQVRQALQQVMQAAREEGIFVVPEGGSTFYHNMTMIMDGHTGIEHNIPIAPVYKVLLTLLGNSKTGYTPTLVVN
jgi:PAS domain-containing protein